MGFFNRRFIKRLKNDFGDLPSEKIELLELLEKNIGPLTPNHATMAYRLCSYSDDLNEIKNNVEKFPAKEIKDNSLARCIFNYGKQRGEEIYNQRRLENSKRVLQDKTNHFIHKKEACQRAAKIGQQKARERDPLYDKKRNVFCKEYYFSRGIFDSKEIEDLMNENRRKSARTKEQFIEKFGLERWNEVCTIRKKAFSNSPFSKISKEATDYFRKVRSFLTTEFDPYDIWWGEHERGEWWIVNKETERRYFIDFCIPSFKIAVEYHGRFYHPKTEDDEIYENFRFGTMLPTKEKFLYDLNKKSVILEKGFTLFEVWSDDPTDPQKLAQEIENEINVKRNL